MEKFSSTIQAATFMISPFTAEKIIYKPKINDWLGFYRNVCILLQVVRKTFEVRQECSGYDRTEPEHLVIIDSIH